MQYSESDWIDKSKGKLGICPFCYTPATHVAKDMVGTRYCVTGHNWLPAMSLLAVPHNPIPRDAPVENCTYGKCPICYQPGIKRYRDGVGTTFCKDNHSWVPKAKPTSQNNETKPIATEQNPVYDPPHQQTPSVNDQLESLTKRIASLEEQFEFFRKFGR